MEDLYAYRYIKLTNGDDLLCQLVLDGSAEYHLFLRYPLKVVTMLDHESEAINFVYLPWVPLTSQEIIAVRRSNIISMTSVPGDIQSIYRDRVSEWMAQLDAKAARKNAEAFSEEEHQEEDESAPQESKKKTWIN